MIIVTYNSALELQGRLRELVEIAGDELFDVVFLDNNSEDNTLEVCSLVPNAHLVKNSNNVGFAQAVNQGLRYVGDHQYFVLLNPDCSIGIDNLRRVIRYLDDNPKRSICSPSIVDENGAPQAFWSVNPGFVSMLVCDITLSLFKYIGWMRRRYDSLDWTDVNMSSSPGFVSGACFAARTSLLDVVGYFDESFFLYYEEMDWCRRATDAGFRLGIVPGVKAVHKAWGSSFSSESVYRMLYRSRYIFLRKHYGCLGEYTIRVADLASGLMRWVLASVIQVVAGHRIKIDLISARDRGKIMALAAIRPVIK